MTADSIKISAGGLLFALGLVLVLLQPASELIIRADARVACQGDQRCDLCVVQVTVPGMPPSRILSCRGDCLLHTIDPPEVCGEGLKQSVELSEPGERPFLLVWCECEAPFARDDEPPDFCTGFGALRHPGEIRHRPPEPILGFFCLKPCTTAEEECKVTTTTQAVGGAVLTFECCRCVRKT